MKRISITLVGSALLIGTSLLAPATLAQGNKPLRPSQRTGHAKRERYPKIRAAIDALQAARLELEHADRDFGGYKRDATLSVDNALKQLRLALQFDR